MGWHGPVDGYKSVAHAIADNFNAEHVAETFTRAGARGDGVGWVRGEASSMDGKPWICCVLVEGGMVKLMGVECGPYFYGCPVEWLDLVPSRGGTSEEHWRAAVRHQAATSRRHPGAHGPVGTQTAAARGGLFDDGRMS